ILEDLDGLQNLSNIGAQLHISVNPALVNLQGLNGLTQLNGGGLHVTNNISLQNFQGLNALTSVGNNSSASGFLVQGNNSLQNFEGLENLTTVRDMFGGSGFHIVMNNALSSLTGLNGLENVFCTLHINDNDQLTSISTLNNLLSSRGLYINFNPLLIEISLNNLSIPAGYSIDISHCNGL